MKIKTIEIEVGEPKTRIDLAEGLRVIAADIESGFYSGIAGWSDVSWNITCEDESDKGTE